MLDSLPPFMYRRIPAKELCHPPWVSRPTSLNAPTCSPQACPETCLPGDPVSVKLTVSTDHHGELPGN